MLVKMLETRRITEDGFNIRRLHKGEVHDLRDHAARNLIKEGLAEVYEGSNIF